MKQHADTSVLDQIGARVLISARKNYKKKVGATSKELEFKTVNIQTMRIQRAQHRTCSTVVVTIKITNLIFWSQEISQ